jgi:hypothetical protein
MLTNIEAWIAQPFSTSMSLWGWALFLIVLITIVYLWNDVLSIVTGGELE